MKSLLIAAAITVFASNVAFAANPACVKQADEKKVAEADRAKFIKQCEKQAVVAATKTCQSEATSKNLDGDRKSSFVTDCVKKAVAAN